MSATAEYKLVTIIAKQSVDKRIGCILLTTQFVRSLCRFGARRPLLNPISTEVSSFLK